MGVTQMTDDLNMNGHHIRDWRYMSDIPQMGATSGQAIVWNGTAWSPATVTGSTVDLVTSVFGRTGGVIGTSTDYAGVVDWEAASLAIAGGATFGGDVYLTASAAGLHIAGDSSRTASLYMGQYSFKLLWPDNVFELDNVLRLPDGLAVDGINEVTTDNGVYVDGLLIKDGLIAWSGVDKTGSSLADLATRAHTALTSIGTNTHAQIDTHLASTSNPHSTTADQVLPTQTSNSGKVLKTNATTASWVALDAAIEICFDGGGATLTVDKKGDYTVPFDMTITGWDLLADQSGSVAIGVWKDTYANYPPTVADVLLTPSITTATKNQASSLSHSLTKGDILRFNVNSVTTIQRVTLALKGTRSA